MKPTLHSGYGHHKTTNVPELKYHDGHNEGLAGIWRFYQKKVSRKTADLLRKWYKKGHMMLRSEEEV